MVRVINAEEFESVAKKSEAAVVDFFATWCGPCKMLSPVLEQISEKMGDQLDFYTLDIDEAPDLAAEFKVQSIPCLIFMKNGELVDQSIGFKPGPAIEEWINSNLG